ncbi:MAG: hypothetical protein MZU91_01375 [Desulfosudis oleivorans]|nr:hypothetical protein [Desulfosudis oleivorans]
MHPNVQLALLAAGDGHLEHDGALLDGALMERQQIAAAPGADRAPLIDLEHLDAVNERVLKLQQPAGYSRVPVLHADTKPVGRAGKTEVRHCRQITDETWT